MQQQRVPRHLKRAAREALRRLHHCPSQNRLKDIKFSLSLNLE